MKKGSWLIFLPFRPADREDRQNEVEHHKHDNLRKQKEGKAHWKPELGSNSEAAVRSPLVGEVKLLDRFGRLGLGTLKGLSNGMEANV